MIKRTTIEIDQDLLERARRALGEKTSRATIEQALRRVADDADAELVHRAANQRRYLRGLKKRIDLSALASEEMWR